MQIVQILEIVRLSDIIAADAQSSKEIKVIAVLVIVVLSQFQFLLILTAMEIKAQ